MSRVRRVFAGVNGSPGSLQALRYAAGLARVHDSALIPVLVWAPPGGELADRRGPSLYLRQVWKDAAWERLWYALDLAFGGAPAGVPVEPMVVRGEPGSVLVRVADSDDDLLVVGAGRRGVFSRIAACRHEMLDELVGDFDGNLHGEKGSRTSVGIPHKGASQEMGE